MVLTGGIDLEFGLTQLQHKTASVLIEDYVWIGAGSIILPGVVLGSQSVVAAGSVVTTDVPSNVMVGGCPAKFIRYINNQSKI